MRALVGVGSPSHTLEAALATAARAAELTGGPPTLLVSGFPAARRAAAAVAKAVGAAAVVEAENCEAVERAVAQADLVVPSAASVRMAICMSAAAARLGKPILHVMFPFGPWTGLYYPLVPRWLQWVEIHGSFVPPPEVKPPPCGPFLDLLKAGPLRRRIAELACAINHREGRPYPSPAAAPLLDLELRPDGTLALKAHGDAVESLQLVRSVQPPAALAQRPVEFLARVLRALGCADGAAGRLAALLGFYIPQIDEGQYVLDTTCVYGGLHNVPQPYHIPYCVEVELLHGLAEEKDRCRGLLAQAAYMAFQELRAAGSGYIPTHPYKCDVVLPLADRLTLEGKVILTHDKNAHKLWTRLGLSSRLLTEQDYRPARPPEHDYAVLQTYAALQLLAGQA